MRHNQEEKNICVFNLDSVDLVKLQTVQCSCYINITEYTDSKATHFQDFGNQIKDIILSVSDSLHQPRSSLLFENQCYNFFRGEKYLQHFRVSQQYTFSKV